MKKYLLLISIIFLSCQEEITLDLPSGDNKLVVEGAIEPGFPPYVILTKNQGYFDPINENTYNNLFVEGASVLVWTYNEDGMKDSVTLTQLPSPFDTIPIYTDTNIIYNPGAEFVGEVGKTYFLEIKWNNQIITSFTTIPEPTPLDCLWVEKNESIDKDHKFDIRAVYFDPAATQNNILIRSKRFEHWEKDSNCTSKISNDARLLLVDAGADVLINGEQFETFFPRPKESGGFPYGAYNSKHYKTCNNGEDSVFLSHDIVLIKFCQIDESSMRFWRGVVRQAGTNGNPFAEPMNLVSNINNGLGSWTGYGAVYYKVPIIKDTTIFEEYSPEIIDIF
ncbi:DUF4249 domain-containing protein [Flavobacteriales bacterium]|nr:DUF4249 domain-containing protein [Flavobacteriales bacterium]